jgi:hypothetical protein
MIDTSPRAKHRWKSLAVDSAFAKDLFDTASHHPATTKLATIADLTTIF